MELLFHIDLLSVGITVASTGVLGFIIFISNRQSATNKAFAFFCTITAVWGILNYVNYQIGSEQASLWVIRFVMFFAILQAYAFYGILSIFPSVTRKYTRFESHVLIPLVVVVALSALTPFVFSAVYYLPGNIVAQPVSGIGIIPFGATALMCVFLGIRNSLRKLRKASMDERRQFYPILAGATIMLILIIICNFVFSVLLNNTSLIPLSSMFTFPFVFLTFYAVSKHNLFNVKVLTTAILTVILAVVTFSEVILSENASAIIFRSVEFILVLVFGSLIVRSVLQEVEAREEVKILADKLSLSNTALERTNERLRIIDQRKSEFVSIVSHQLRTPITAIKGYSSMLLEESYGKISKEAREPIEKIFHSSKRLAEMVTDFLDVSKIEQGTMTYTFTSVDIGALIADLGDDFAQVAKNKKLKFAVRIPKKEKFIATADEGKIRQIFSNLIDNSIKYTPKGGVVVSIARDEERGMIIVNIKDTGIGLSQDDIHHLFGKFTRGSGGQKQDTEGSGLGLYVAKSMLEAQKGNIWVDSEGPGKGSTFFIELRAE